MTSRYSPIPRQALTVLAPVLLATRLAAADSNADALEALKAQIRELDQKVRILERRQELDKEAATEKAKTAPVVTIGSGGLAIRSGDSNFVVRVRGYVQADSRLYANDAATGTANDTFLIRRARPIIEGTAYDKYDFRFMMDFASGITSVAGNNAFLQDGYLNARFYPGFQLQVGKFKEPVGLERLQSGANMLFVERGYPTQLVPNRDVGAQIQGDLFDNRLRYELGVFNGVADGGSGDIEASDDEKDVAGRLFTTPFRNGSTDALKGIGFGVAGTVGNQEGALRTYSSPGQQRIFNYRSGSGTLGSPNVVADGVHWRIVPQAYYYWGPFGAFAEYAISDQRIRLDDGARTFRRSHNTGWQLSTSYVLTGEENSWKGITPKHPFSPGDAGWGAWEIAARVGQLDLDKGLFPLYANPDTSAHRSTSWGVGLNWYLNKNVKFNLDYEDAQFDGGKSEFLQKGEKVILSRAQFAF